ncbi:uncharacterized protein I206_101027 [Kwoniella pini CBS 10737]|uniref:Xylanolytic transcriptional activator regulatory domain-containing protein n=1 Tax=Kwoniella pini CBS 10737 TaxID=1296096 RepID=A0A1B9IBI1_9TREE|nr:uncharacterized protein I206_00299 [Kwoniella pini CBS 10737]OCF52998.1 hypothetical protein I206_00299 [Kwoniella pini CBS 10737]
MTELEDLIELHTNLWDAAFPNFPLDQAVARSVSSSPSDIAHQAIDSLGLRQNPEPTINLDMPPIPLEDTFTTLPELPVLSQLHMQPNSLIHVPNTTASSQPSHPSASSHTALSEIPNEAYPPTRAASPMNTPFLQNVYDFQSAAQAAASDWSEPHAAKADDTPPGQLDGLGAMKLDTVAEMKAGAGYIGMSSMAMLILVLRRLVNRDSLLSPLNDTTSHEFVSTDTNSQSAHNTRHDITPPLLSGPSRLPRYIEFRPLVDSYFQYFHAIIPIVHEPTIRAQLTGALPLPSSGGSRVLIFMIFAMGAFDQATSENDDNGYRYYEIARQAYQPEMVEEGSMQLVQGLAIMANYLQRNNKPNSGYVCLGTAIRMAVALGIHSSAGHPNTNPLDGEIRTRLWWGLVALEAGCSTTFGRPHGFGHASYLLARRPVNCDDDDLTVGDSALPQDVDRVALYTALVMQTKLAKKMLHLQDRISRSLPYPTIDQIKWCGEAFLADVQSYPAYMQPGTPGPFRLARAIQNWRARDFASILYRPVLLSAAWNSSGPHNVGTALSEVIDACRSLAMETLRELRTYGGPDRDLHRGSQWYLLFYEVQSSLTLLLSVVWEPQHPSSEEWRTMISQSIQRIREMRSVSKMGSSYAQTMENILQAQPSLDINNVLLPLRPQDQVQPLADANAVDWNQFLIEILASQNMTQEEIQGINTSPFAQDPTLYPV